MGKTSDTWRSKRRTLWIRSQGRCHYCGGFTIPEERTSDHIVPRAFGGPDALWNLTACCLDCNSGHGDAVRKCECRTCVAALDRFHRFKLRAASPNGVAWERHRSDEWVITNLLNHIKGAQRALDRMEDLNCQDAIALRGKLSGLRIGLQAVAVNKVVDDLALSEPA